MGGGVIARETAKVTSGGYEIHIMDLKCQEEIAKVEGHFGPINWVTYHNDGNGFVTAGSSIGMCSSTNKLGRVTPLIYE